MNRLQALKLSNKIYDGIKFNVLIFIPTIGVVAFLVSLILESENVKWLLFIILLVELILGSLLYVSGMQHKGDGAIIITRGAGGKTIFSLELEMDPDDIKTRDSILFKVTNEVDGIRE